MSAPIRIGLEIAYDGTAYCGWQVQPNGPTVQAALEAAITRLTGESTRVRGAGRTDAGVHALGQVAVFETASTIPPEQFHAALNTRLPADIAVRRSFPVSPDFDPRRDARRKLYRYRLWTGPVRPVLERHLLWHVREPLDIGAMREAASRFAGTHDFSSFAASGGDPARDPVRTIDRAEVLTRDGEDEIRFEVEGRSFLYNQVRAMTGTLVDVGAGRISPERIGDILEARDRSAAGQGAPALGLCLVWIRYGGCSEPDAKGRT